ncbi:MAG: hypothetical protein LBO66_07525 [Deltaproteobacteria bacterium]|jgi:hypothetical protein|nr:hypothetical protein [Deltaproteobacteria bacterium]
MALKDDLDSHVRAIVREEVTTFLRDVLPAPEPVEEKGYLSPTQVESQYGLRASTLCRWRGYRIGPPYCKVMKKILYSRKDIEEYIEKFRMKTRQRRQ